MIGHFLKLSKQQKRNSSSKGFTIVELLIVVVVIGILAAIVTVAYTGITERANAAAVADGFKKFEKAMRLYVTSNGLASWPGDSTLTGGGNPNIPSLITNVSGFSNYMQSAPSVAGISGSSWRYDNDGDTYNGCSVSDAGVNIFISPPPATALAQKIDDAIDDGNLSCGRLRLTSTLIFNLNNNSSL